MSLEVPGVTRIDTPAEARSNAKRALKMSPAKAQAAHDWANRQEEALKAGQHAYDRHMKGAPPELSPPERHRFEDQPSQPRQARESGARRAAHAAYKAARPPAMRIVHNGRQHFFQGVKEPFGPVGGGWDLLMEGLGLSLAVVLIADLLKAPKAIATTSTHALAAVQRAVGVVDPLTGKHA